MYVKAFNSVTEIGENQWNSIVGRNKIICSYNFLLALEKSNINDCKYFYPVIFNNGEIIAHACAYSITTDLDTIATGILKKIIQLIRVVWKNFLKIKFLECGSPVALGNTISFSDDIEKKEALSLLIDCIEKIANEKNIPIIVFRDFYEDELNFFNNIICKGYKRSNNLPDTILKIRWNSFDEYLNDLKSHYRNEVKKNINIAKNKNLVIEVCDNFSDLSEYLQILWHNVYDNAKEYKREIVTKEFFINLDTYLNGKAKVILLKKDSKIIGFALLLSDDDILRFMYSGIDYNYNKECSVYFNSIYSVINQAIVEGKKEIDVGISTYIPKMKIGAIMEYLYIYMKHTNKLLNPIITNLFDMMNPKIKIKTYNVFKEKIENKIAKNYSIMHN